MNRSQLIRKFIGIAILSVCGINASGQSERTRVSGQDRDWPTYYGDDSGRRYSPLSQIDRTNADKLTLAWTFPVPESALWIKSTPLMVRGILYFTLPDRVWAVDARSGREIWHFQYDKQGGFYTGQRGVGFYKGRLYFVTNDAHLLCLDARDGSVRWTVEIADVKVGFFSTLAPQVVKNHVLVGVSGDYYDLNGFIRAYDPDTGKIQWQWNSIPRPGEPGSESWPKTGDAIRHGGGMTWMSGTYDPQLNLIYWGIGNPNPTMSGEGREGDNLYTCSIVALDPDNGALRWHFQVSPHDVHDWDAVEDPVLIDSAFQGQERRLLLQASRNGYFFVLDRVTGKSLLSKPFIRLNWSLGVDKEGRPIRDPKKDPSAAGVLVSPASNGANNWRSPSFSSDTKLFYVNTVQSFGLFYHLTSGKAVGYAGKDFLLQPHSYLKAINYQTGEPRWTYDLGEGEAGAGILTTAGQIVFTADVQGNLLILDAHTGSVLWHANCGGWLADSPMTYQLDGRQYLVIGNRGALFAWALPESMVRDLRLTSRAFNGKND